MFWLSTMVNGVHFSKVIHLLWSWFRWIFRLESLTSCHIVFSVLVHINAVLWWHPLFLVSVLVLALSSTTSWFHTSFWLLGFMNSSRILSSPWGVIIGLSSTMLNALLSQWCSISIWWLTTSIWSFGWLCFSCHVFAWRHQSAHWTSSFYGW